MLRSRSIVTGLALALTLGAANAHAAEAARSRQLGDAEILSVLQVVNLDEVIESRGAQSRATNADVKAYAELMVKDHTRALRMIKSVARGQGTNGQPSNLSHQLAMQARTELGQLENNQGAAFDQAFVQHEIDEHQQVLNIIQRQLMPNAQSTEVTNLLEDARAMVSRHLRLAQQLQTQLGGGGGGGT